MLECEVMPIFFSFSKQFVKIFKKGNIFAVFGGYLLGDKIIFQKYAYFSPSHCLPIRGISVQKVHRCNQKKETYQIMLNGRCMCDIIKSNSHSKLTFWMVVEKIQ